MSNVPSVLGTVILNAALAIALTACSSPARVDEPREGQTLELVASDSRDSGESDRCRGLGISDCNANPACAAFAIGCGPELHGVPASCAFSTQCARADADPTELPRAPSCRRAICAAFESSLVDP